MMEAARWLIAFVSAGTSIGALCVDYLLSTGMQHIRNPKWPPHAKFHNGQTIMMGMMYRRRNAKNSANYRGVEWLWQRSGSSL